MIRRLLARLRIIPRHRREALRVERRALRHPDHTAWLKSLREPPA